MKYDYLKNNYIEAREKAKENNITGYSFQQISCLQEMAAKEVYPDGRFSDEECNIWFLFRMKGN